MKALNLSIAIIALTLTTVARAERWIVENAKFSTVATGQVVGTLTLGDKTFTILETGHNISGLNFAQSLKKAMGADDAYPDLQIGIVQDIPTTQVAQGQPWHVKKLDYDRVHKSNTGRGVIVAVLDTGVDYRHDALKGKIWVNKREVVGNGVDDDKNGYIDDVMGYDFDGKDADPMDDMGHGTHCAGIIGSDADQNSGAQGIAPEVQIMPVRVIGSDGPNFLSNAAMAIKYAVDNGAKVLSNSWRVYASWSGFNPNEKNIAILKAGIEYATSRGVIFVAAAGNESIDIDQHMVKDPIYPIGFKGIPLFVGVGSSDQKDGLSYFSNFGRPYVSVVAPGTDIISTYPGNRWTSMSGTSMATPLVAGALALGLERGQSPQQATQKLVSTSDKLTNMKNAAESEGIINVLNFLR